MKFSPTTAIGALLPTSDDDTVASMSFGGSGLLTRSLGHCDAPPTHASLHSSPTCAVIQHADTRTQSAWSWQQWSSGDAIAWPYLFKRLCDFRWQCLLRIQKHWLRRFCGLITAALFQMMLKTTQSRFSHKYIQIAAVNMSGKYLKQTGSTLTYSFKRDKLHHWM